jgi:heterodisulfide reductase subunit A
MAVSKANKIEPLTQAILPMNHNAMVIGGGISGLSAALNLAKQGFTTYLIEKEAHLGGFARNIHQTIDQSDVKQFLADLITEAHSNENLEIFTQTEIDNIEGFVGNFKTTLKINGETSREIDHGVVIVATGGMPYVPKGYLYSKDPRVLTQIEFEQAIVEKKIEEKVQQIVMIQCIGSRNEEHPYCSRVCCAEAIKNAIKIKTEDPTKDVVILYRDIRTYGFKEKYYRIAREKGVIFLRFDKDSPPELKTEDTNLIVSVDTPSLGKIQLQPDLLVLSAGIQPPYASNKILAPMLKVPLNADKFFLEAHVKLRPVDFSTEGIFVAGLAHSPKSIDESIMQAGAAVSRAMIYLSKEEIEAEGIVAEVDPSKCSGCCLCIETCAYNAITFIEEKGIVEINSALCKGCGACTGNCRSSAIDLLGFTNQQIYLVINEFE